LEPTTLVSAARRTSGAPASETLLYPLRFQPIYQYRLWGGRRLADLLTAPLPVDGPVGEAWVLSDRDDHPSRVADGPLNGQTITQLLQHFREQLMGKLAQRFHRFPLLLKFLDAHEMLSVQVHPSDAYTDLLPPGESGKTESWLVLEAGTKSRIYAGLTPGTTATDLKQALANGVPADNLVHFTPKPGDAFFLPAGTVHTLGGDVVVFELQQNSDVTFRLYDWDRVEATTGRPRPLQVDQAFACIDSPPLRPLWSYPWWRRQLRSSASDFLIADISGCGAGADNRRLPSGLWPSRACWFASRGRGGLSTETPLTE
jgi:mannose-6-phosphate isomerase